MPDSIDTQEIQVKSKRPADSAFKQQKLPAWQPVLTAGTVLPTFFVIGIAFIPVGVALLYFSDAIREHVIDYTDCMPVNQPSGSNQTCADILLNDDSDSAECQCKIDFVLEKDFLGKVYMYYGLTNYYQNHRRYVRSRDDDQLLGRLSQTPASECAPFAFDDTNRPIAPCGAIANSLFSDRLQLRSLVHNTDVPVLNTGIAWPSDKNIRFRNPEGDLREAIKEFAAPKHWRGKTLADLDPENESNNGFQNEDLIVWMRTAALPSFRKLYRRIDHSKNFFADGLHKGNYTLNVNYLYSVKEFSGRKKFILSTTSLLGGKNPFLGVAYIVVGSVCLLIGIILLFIHIKCSKSTTDMEITPRTSYT